MLFNNNILEDAVTLIHRYQECQNKTPVAEQKAACSSDTSAIVKKPCDEKVARNSKKLETVSLNTNRNQTKNKPPDFSLKSDADFPVLGGGCTQKAQNNKKFPTKNKARKALKLVDPNDLNQSSGNLNRLRFSTREEMSPDHLLENQISIKEFEDWMKLKGLELENYLEDLETEIKNLQEAEVAATSTIRSCDCDSFSFDKLDSLKRFGKDYIEAFSIHPSCTFQFSRLVDIIITYNGQSTRLDIFKRFPTPLYTDLAKEISTTEDVYHLAIVCLDLMLEGLYKQLFSFAMLKSMINSISIRKCPLLLEFAKKLNNEINKRGKTKFEEQYLSTKSNCEISKTVGFQIETDSRQMFSSNPAFDGFIKQRDLFYKLYTEWTGKEVTKDVAALIVQMNTLHTHKPFSRLFLKQILWTYANENTEQRKATLLNNRLSTSENFQFCQFTTLQFFKEFVDKADSYRFQNALLDTIRTYLRKTESANDTYYDEKTTVSTKSLKYLLQKLSHLRLIGHFYGYLVFSSLVKSADKPGATDEDIPGSAETLCRDIIDSLLSALKEGHILPTLTWAVQALSLVPKNAPWLLKRSMLRCLQTLVQIHEMFHEVIRKKASKFSDLATKTINNPFVILYSISSIGMLFEPETLGEGLFFQIQNKTFPMLEYVCEDINSLDVLATHLPPSCDFFMQTHWRLIKCESIITSPLIDDLLPITASSVDAACPKKIKRHATNYQPAIPGAREETKRRFQKMFLNQQPESTGRVVQFVIDRCLSCCVRYITPLIQNMQFDDHLFNRVTVDDDTTKLVDEIVSYVAIDTAKEIKTQAFKYIEVYTEESITKLMGLYTEPVLLTENTYIATYEAMVLTIEWLEKHLDELLVTNVKNKVKSKQEQLRFQLENIGEETLNLTEIPHGEVSRLIMRLKELALSQSEKTKKIDYKLSRKVLEEVCTDFLVHFYQPSCTKVKCPPFLKNRICTFAFLIRELVLSIDSEKSVESTLQHLKMEEEHFNQLTWLLKMVDRFDL